MDAKALGENFSSSGVLNKKGRELNANDLAEVLNHYWLTVTRGNTKTFKTMCQITISFGEIECQRSVWYGGWEKEHRKIATQCVFYEVLNDNAKIQLQRQ
jgi:hypothetical protein